MRAFLQRLLSGGARYVPHGSWSVFHPTVVLRQLHPRDKLNVRHSPYLTFVQTHVYPSKLQRTIFRVGTLVAVSSAMYQFMTNLHSVPITGRTQVVVLTDEEEIELGSKYASEEIADADLITSGPRLRTCVDVAARLVSVSDHLFPRPYEWTLWLVDAPDVANACCFSGGKMIIYSGILDVVDAAVEKGLVANKHDALAVILSHEMGHALARHTAERMSYLPLLYLQVILGLQSPLLEYVFELAMNLPFSRKQEMEADHIGLMLMASACYDPATAAKFWVAFNQADHETGGELMNFLSTHPSHQKRIRTLDALTEEALKRQQECTWCFQVKERVQALISDTPVRNEFLERIRRLRTLLQPSRGGTVRRNTVGTLHELENEEIYRVIRDEQEKQLRLSEQAQGAAELAVQAASEAALHAEAAALAMDMAPGAATAGGGGNARGQQ